MNYNDLTLQELVDLLAVKTKRMSELMVFHQFQDEEYKECNKAVKEIQKVIQQKQGNSNNVSA